MLTEKEAARMGLTFLCNTMVEELHYFVDSARFLIN
jgi:hypothetical protein